MNKEIKISYNTEAWDKNGFHYTQLIRVNKDIIEGFNNYVKRLYEEANKKLSNETQMYLQVIPTNEKIAFINLTTANYFDFYLTQIGINTKRFLHDRNTRILIEEN